MQDHPTAAEMLNAVINFLRNTAVPALAPREAFEARVAANALEIVRREITIGRAAEGPELAGLQALLGQDGELPALNAELAARLADGRLTGTPEVLAHLWAATLDKLAVDQPGYEAYRLAVTKHET